MQGTKLNFPQINVCLLLFVFIFEIVFDHRTLKVLLSVLNLVVFVFILKYDKYTAILACEYILSNSFEIIVQRVSVFVVRQMICLHGISIEACASFPGYFIANINKK